MKKILVLVFLFPTIFASPAPLEKACTTKKGGYFAAVSEEIFDEAMDYAVKKDPVALQSLFDTGNVFTLKPGAKVYVKSLGMFSGKVKIRPVGSTVWFWTVIEAFDC